MRAMIPHRLNGAGFTLVLLALVFRLLVPQGTMVGTEPHGPALVICTGHGPLSAPDQASGKSKASTDCAFAAHVAVGSSPEPARFSAPVPWSMFQADIAPSEDDPRPGFAAPLPPPIGPPILHA